MLKRDSLGGSNVDMAIADLIMGLQDANGNWVREPEPFYGHLLSQLRRKVVDSETTGRFACPTCAVGIHENGIWLIVNSDFFDKLTNVERVAVVKHEAQHVAHRHLFRFGRGNYTNREQGNIAMDAVINQFNTGLPDREIEGYTSPGHPFEPVDYKKIPNCKPDTSWEWIYELLEQEAEEDDSGGDGDGDDDGTGVSETAYGDTFDDHSQFGAPVDDETSEELVENQLKEQIRQAARKCQPGNISNEIQQILDDISKESKVPWKVLLRRWIKQSTRRVRELHILRESRCVPGVFPGFKSTPVPEFHVYADMSGSVSDDEAIAFFGEVLAINKTMKATVFLHQFDTKIHKSEKIERKVPNIERVAAGGTSFQCIVDHAHENKIRNIIIMTDGYAAEVDTKGLNVLWVYTSDHQEHPGKGIVLEDA